MTPEQTETIMAMLTAAFPQKPISEATVGIYEHALADLDFDAVRSAVMRLMATEEWLPTIAKIRRAAYELEHGKPTPGLEAWALVGEAIRKVGIYGAPRFRDPILGRCVAAMGWRYLCKSPNETSDRARFVELYEAWSQAEAAEGALPPALRAPERRRALGRELLYLQLLTDEEHDQQEKSE